MSELLDCYLNSGGNDEDKKEVIECYSTLLGAITRDTPLNILEIGAGRIGASVKMWREHFYNANVFSFDPFFLEDQIVTPEELKNLDITPIQGNQLSRGDLYSAALHIVETTGKGIDLVVDDAAHMPDAIQISLGVLFPFLNASGIYFVEDLNTTLRRAMDIEDVNKNLEELDIQKKMTLRHVDEIHLFDAIHHLARKRIWPSKVLSHPETEYLAAQIVYATILSKEVEFDELRRWNFGDEEASAKEEEVAVRLRLPFVGVLRKSQFHGVAPYDKLKEVPRA